MKLYDLRLYFDGDDFKRRQVGLFYGEDSAKAAVDCLESGQSNLWKKPHKMAVYCNGEVICTVNFYGATNGTLDDIIIQLSKIIDP